MNGSHPDGSLPRGSGANAIVGILGGGQLARMLAEAATPLGIRVRVLAAPGDEGASEVVPEVTIGDPMNPRDVISFAELVDVVTIDHENISHDALVELEARGIPVRPGTATLALSDKAFQRESFAASGIPVPAFVVVDPAGDLATAISTAESFAQRCDRGVVAKASRGGYDGRAVWMLEPAEVESFVESYSGAPLVLEERVDLAIELAVLVARNPSGAIATWPVLETVQVDGMCDEVVFPAPVTESIAARAREVAASVAELAGSIGVLAVELFVDTDERVLVNEIAPRVHNSGHLTIEGSATSQFEQHLRAILDWPLGPTEMRAGSVVMSNVVGVGQTEPRTRQALALRAVPEAHVHLYGKAPRDRRKIGHVTVLGGDREHVRGRAATASALLGGGAVE